MKPKSSSRGLITLNAKIISYAHTLFASCAFLGALIVGVWLHYEKIVENEHYGYPDEWFPSVSATIGDRYPERSVFQVFIAITSGPRFALVFLTYLLTDRPGSISSKILLVSGLLRTLTCGGWTYITSTDDHDWHDIFMISYMVLTIPWTTLRISLDRPGKAYFYRRVFATLFFVSLIPLIYFFIQHKVHRVAGAYTHYSFFEWALIVFDVSFDAVTAIDFSAIEIQLHDTQGIALFVSSQAAQASQEEKPRKHLGFSWFEFVVAILNGYTFWTVLTALPLLIWYFPLWHMGISGYEAFLLTIVAPVLLLVPFVRNMFAYFHRLPLLLTTVGIASFWAKKPEVRLELVGLAAGFAAISLAINFWGISNKPYGGTHRGTAFSLGLILSAISKFACYTNNPAWPIMHDANGGWNRTGLAIAVVAALLSTRLQYSNQSTAVASKKESSLGAAMGVGGLLFALHTLLSDSSTITLWVWDGYPVTGPLPVPHGALTIGAMLLGAYLGVVKRGVTGNWSAYIVSNIGAILLYSFHGWVGYIGGLILAVYLVSIVPVILESAGRHNPGKTFGLGFFFLVLIYLAHVWIVAYAFVPGGPYLRERTDLVLAAQQVLIGGGIYAHNKIRMPSLSTSSISLVRKLRSQVILATTVLLALTCAIGFKRFHRPDPQPYHPEDKVMTAGIWTVHFGLDNDMWASETRMRDVIHELEIDVIGFLESDTQRAIMGHRDITQQIAEELGYYADFGPGPNKHTWGAALLSKFPILKSTHHLLPSPVGELAPAIHATLDVYGKEIDVVVFHSGQEEDKEDRRLQSLGVADIMASSSNPLVLLSYLVTKPLQGNYNTYVSEHSRMHDIDSTDWDRWCEYILYRDVKRTGYARVSRSTITDTEIQVGKFAIGDDTPSTETRIDESQVAPGLRFPAMFRGDGVRGHRYHVFDEPRYFA
ncbi:protein Cwh43p [Trichomonascus vanleenenianus]|uniref:Cwh43p n=1 Tax=Trichomonascus vanleenenianus TaxID=2268995 RepID=UPI003EC97980